MLFCECDKCKIFADVTVFTAIVWQTLPVWLIKSECKAH